VFLPNRVRIGDQSMPFPSWSSRPIGRVQLSAAGFYKTPEDPLGPRKPAAAAVLYFAYGAAVSEVSIDTLTGE
jgi:xanthine dehydrogenase large subunit